MFTMDSSAAAKVVPKIMDMKIKSLVMRSHTWLWIAEGAAGIDKSQIPFPNQKKKNVFCDFFVSGVTFLYDQ